MIYQNLRTKMYHTIGLLSLLVVSLISIGGTATAESVSGITWKWIGYVGADPAAQSALPDPENYYLTLQTDGSLRIKADCTMMIGSYTMVGNSLSIMLGPSTMAYCGDGSQDYWYLAMLGEVESYAIEEGDLVLALKDDAGKMIFEGR